MKRYVIIGNGAAAVGCVEGIRETDREGGITIVSAESHPCYCRPLISYLLEGKAKPENMSYRPDGFYQDNGCTVLYGRTAASLDAGARSVTLDDGTSLGYDALCVATGSSPFVPPFEGLETVEKRFPFMTLDDARRLEQAIDADTRVLIVGAGLIGLKCAEGVVGRVSSVEVCDLAPRVLSSILDDGCAAIMQKALEEHGVRFTLGDTVSRFEGNTAIMQSGKRIEFDVLVTAVGVRANTALVKEAGGEVGRGIVVDSRMRTSLDGVYSAGDCTESVDVSSGERRVMAVLPNAVMQGRCAGITMAGGDAVFDKAVPMNSIGFFGVHAMSAGSCFSAGQGGECHERTTPDGLRRLYVRGGVLTGFVLIGKPEPVGIYTRMIRERTPIEQADIELLEKYPNLLPFGSAYRGKCLGGVV